MTPKKAIDFINNEVQIDVRFCTEEKVEKTKEVFKLAIKALEKQIPKKPDLEGDGYDENGVLIYDTGFCPNCRHIFEVDYEATSYCPICGQALDWSDTE